MSWEKILKISTKDAIADARRNMHEEDKNPSPALDSSRLHNPNSSYPIETSNLMEVKAQIKGLKRGYGVMKKSYSLLSTSLFNGYDDEFDIGYHLDELKEPITKLENSIKQVGELQ